MIESVYHMILNYFEIESENDKYRLPREQVFLSGLIT